jgi:hypothetical protein
MQNAFDELLDRVVAAPHMKTVSQSRIFKMRVFWERSPEKFYHLLGLMGFISVVLSTILIGLVPYPNDDNSSTFSLFLMLSFAIFLLLFFVAVVMQETTQHLLSKKLGTKILSSSMTKKASVQQKVELIEKIDAFFKDHPDRVVLVKSLKEIAKDDLSLSVWWEDLELIYERGTYDVRQARLNQQDEENRRIAQQKFNRWSNE